MPFQFELVRRRRLLLDEFKSIATAYDTLPLFRSAGQLRSVAPYTSLMVTERREHYGSMKCCGAIHALT